MRSGAAGTAVALLALAAAGCGSSTPGVAPDPNADPTLPRTRYSFNNHCFALKSVSSARYLASVASTSGGAAHYSADADGLSGAEAFFLKPAALGDYLLYDRSGQLVAAAASTANPQGASCDPNQTVCAQALASASDSARFVMRGAGDATDYPVPPQFNIEPPPAQILAYRNFNDPEFKSTVFTLASYTDGRRLTAAPDGSLGLAAADDSAQQQFALEALAPASCTAFPEADASAHGETFKGTTLDGRVLGMADVHVHVGSTTFLGGGFSGTPFHRFGVTHALADCASTHGPGGSKDVIGTFLGGEAGHATDGWPTFTDWPSAHSLTHQAIYWKWLERGWLAGVRILVNDLVENGTLC